MTTAGYTLGWLREYVCGLEYAAERGAIEEYLFETDAEFNFRVDNRGKFAGVVVELAYSPAVKFDSATGIVYAHEVSARHNVHAHARISDAAREEFNDYFSALFELAQASDSFTA